MLKSSTMAQLTTSQVARQLGITPTRVLQLVRAGRIACEETPLGRLFDQAEVQRVKVARAAGTFRLGQSKGGAAE
jgi:hypothetical protein